MKRQVLRIMILTLLSAMTGCDTPQNEDEEQVKDNQEEDYGGWHDTIVPDSTYYSSYMTVTEAIEAPDGEPVNVKGYILGSASRTIHNAIMAPPFESRSSLILADRIPTPGDKPGEYDPFYEDELLPVCLTDFKDTQAALNLVDHPEHWHRQVFIFGIRKKYIGMPGIKTVMKYEFVE